MISKNMMESLNRHMNLELNSAHIYLSMSSCANSLGLKGAANWFMVQYREEMTHFIWLIRERMFCFLLPKRFRIVIIHCSA